MRRPSSRPRISPKPSGVKASRPSPLSGDAALVRARVTAAAPGVGDSPRQDDPADEARDGPRPALASTLDDRDDTDDQEHAAGRGHEDEEPGSRRRRDREAARHGVEPAHAVQDALGEIALSEGREDKRVHDLLRAAVVGGAPRRPERDGGPGGLLWG